jgi:predicted acetyltransferase
VRLELASLALKGLIKDIVMADTRSKKITTKAQTAISRSEILDEIWSAKKYTVDGHWYVRLSDVCEILGEDYARQEAKANKR